ncbi:sterol desaturase family protein [Pseudomonas paraeruginosa]|uniref:sterol desaturase family protein n=1 Tax=Pseudomonas paraeruginosa TaxID=2994495 RepID=UPI0039FCB5CB
MTADLMHWLHAFFGTDVNWMHLFLVGMTPIFLLTFMIEFVVERKRGHSANFYWKEIVANTTLGITYLIASNLAGVLFTAGLFAWVYEHRIFTIPVNIWTIVPIFFLVELCYYWYHRSSHRIRWFWTAHVSHHSGQRMNLSTAARQSILNPLIATYVFYLPPVLLGVPPAVVVFLLSVDLAYQYFVHTETIGRFPAWYEYIFDTPSNHRVHHGRNPQYIDKNYGGVLIIYDRMFGTYEKENEKVEYGITQQIKSYNFLVLNFHEFVDMWRDTMAPGPLWQRLKHLWMPPEWEREGHEPIHTWTVELKGGSAESMQPVVSAKPSVVSHPVGEKV